MIFDRLVRFLLPREDQFFALLEELAGKIEEGATLFAQLATASTSEQIGSVASRLKPLETDSDGVCQRMYEAIDKTFVTPIDREDLARLTKVLDNVVDGMEHTASFAALFRFAELTAPMKHLVRITVDCAREIAKAARNLRKFATPDSVKGPTIAVHRLENEADAVYRKGIAELFSNGITAVELVRQKDMLFSLEEGVDQCEDAMDAIRSVVVKNGYAFTILVVVVVLALVFDYINGFHDTANAVATVVSTNVLPGRTAVILAAVCNFFGAFVGVGVAKTIGGDIADPASITQLVVAAALLGAIFWNLLTWYYGIPSSSSHALIGGLVGAVWCHYILHGRGAGEAMGDLLTSKGVILTLKALVLSPLCGLLGGFLLMVLLLWLVRRTRPSSVNRNFRVLQLGSASFMAFSHGSNDAQKSMGIITLALVAYAVSQGQPGDLHPPWWVIISCATAMALGTASGGWRIMKTMGHRIIKLRPINGFAAETSASIVILIATWLKAPVSTTHVISSCIMGVGASKRVSAVRWGVARTMLIAWVLTIPISAAVAALTYLLLHAALG